MSTADEVAKAVLFLASPDSSYITCLHYHERTVLVGIRKTTYNLRKARIDGDGPEM